MTYENYIERGVKKIQDLKFKLHEKTIDELVLRLSNTKNSDGTLTYDYINSRREYTIGLERGEVDVYAVTTVNGLKYYYVFEIKATNSQKNRNKARKQLSKDKRFFLQEGAYRVLKFYVTPKFMRYIK